MGTPEDTSNRKGLTILLMGLSVIMCLFGQFSQHWFNWDIYDFDDDFEISAEPVNKGYASLREIHVAGENDSSFDEISTYYCELENEWEWEWAGESCSLFRELDSTGSTTSLLLWISTATGIWFLIVAYRSIEGKKEDLSLALLDHRFCLSSGGLAILGSIFWRVNANDVLGSESLGWEVGAAFYVTLIGGLLAILSYSMIIRSPNFTKDKEAAERRSAEKSAAKRDAELKSAEERVAAMRDAEDQRLLNLASEAVKAKAEAEANPDDPLLWLRMAEAMDAANRQEEAERARKTAMELMEK